ncbi:PH domain-containing protein DDB_G0274775-like [Dendronephthya gigantea]|uniref:PH domain-containing protein DDB_G0274775-like n=1 Tax=Dendronephthya gigantea TaxID=151771 RepID=UPI00106D5DB3|nr:PH domain-containing protein DDB_G0274775-like [Dendronephthya gigantea]XP_028418380.1 PH domain-containing protein DDB_G0274775-like [Dendronephthya gigantea]
MSVRITCFNMAADKECEVDNVSSSPNTGETGAEATEKSGWLLKRTKHSKQWEKKWFSLKERTLYYGDSPDDTSKSFVLDSCEIATCEIKSKNFTFCLKPKDTQRKYFLCAETESELQEWMQVLYLARSLGQKNTPGSEACVIQ